MPAVVEQDYNSGCAGGASEAQGERVIDWTHLSRYTLDDRALELEILSLFIQQALGLVSRLENSREPGEWSYATHSLKGAARAVGAWRVAAIAESLEQAGPDHAAVASLDELRSEIDLAVKACRER